MINNEDDEIESGDDIRSSNFTEVVSLLFVTMVLLFLSLKILLF